MTATHLKGLRRRLKLSQGQFGAKVGVTKTSVYMWESGRTPIPKWLTFAVWALKGPGTG
jgi:DNA-binding XRE family transcriptional regulator